LIAHLGAWYWNIQTDDCTWTDEAYRIFGWAPQAFKVTMERFLAAIVEEDRPRVQAAIRAAIVDGQPYRVEYDIVLPDGSRRHIREEGEVSLDENGNAATMIGGRRRTSRRKHWRPDQVGWAPRAHRTHAACERHGGHASFGPPGPECPLYARMTRCPSMSRP
jgi:hypothetical protein